MIHSSYLRPRIMPLDADLAPANIDRLQDLTVATTLNRERIKEIGTDGLVSWKTSIPTVNATLRQLEYGDIAFWRKLTCQSDAVNAIEFTDFKTPRVNLAAYETDDDATFTSTLWLPKLRTSGFTINFAAPDGLIERNITLVGEDEITFQNDNKYVIYKRYVASGGANETFSISDPTPVADPDNSGQYLLQVVRTTGGVTTLLTHGTDWSYDGAGTLTINGTSSALDIIRVWYTAGSYIGGETPFTSNTTSLGGIDCDSVSLYLESSNYLYLLQSASLEVTFDRFDVKELGSQEVQSYGIRNVNTRLTLGRILEAYTIEEVVRGVAGLDYGKIDVRNFTDNLSFSAKIYTDETKSTFSLGYKLTDLAPTAANTTVPTDDYINRGITLEGEVGLITNQSNLM